jgi:hypothetical protein
LSLLARVSQKIIQLFQTFIDDEKTFITRLKHSRFILYKKSFVTMQQFTKNIETPHRAKIISYDGSKKRKKLLLNMGQKKTTQWH